MYDDLLEYIVKKKVYVEIAGVSRAGRESTISPVEKMTNVYKQGDAIFSTSMIATLLFHEKGCTITLKR